MRRQDRIHAKVTRNKTYVVTCENYGMQQRIFINCNESMVISCISQFVPNARWFQEASEVDIQAARMLHIPVYMY